MASTRKAGQSAGVSAVARLSALAPVYRPGSHGNFEHGIGVALSEVVPTSIVQLAAWSGKEKKLIGIIGSVMGLALPDAAGGGAVEGTRAAFGLASIFAEAMEPDTGTVTDLSHGRTVIRIEGPEVEWIMAKFFALDFSLPAFPVGAGRSTAHHDIFAQIQRTAAEQFDIYVFRSFARSFWTALCRGCEEVGYEVQ